MRFPVKIDMGPLERKIGRFPSRAQIATRNETYRWAQEVIAPARKKWPVDTGYTRAGLGVFRTGGGARIVNSASDAAQIYLRAVRDYAWNHLVRKPAFAAVPALKTRLAAALVRAFRG